MRKPVGASRIDVDFGMARRSGHCRRRLKERPGPGRDPSHLPFASRTVRVDQRQLKPRLDDRRQVAIVAAAQFEAIASSLERYGLKPVRPRTFGLGQHEMIEINLIQSLGSAVPSVAGWVATVRSCLAWPEAFTDLPVCTLGLGPG
jgi:hypothetical protein